MDDLLREFLTETGEHLETVDAELLRFEERPNDPTTLRKIFRLVHTIKGTCGFLGLARLGALAHAAETLMAELRDGAPVTTEAISCILSTVDRLKLILAGIERLEREPAGRDDDLIGALADIARAAQALRAPARPDVVDVVAARISSSPPSPAGLSVREPRSPGMRGRSGEPTIRVGVDTLERLMTTVSELVLTRNQLLDLARRSGGAGLNGPLQRLSHVTAELQDGIMRTRMQPIGSAWVKLPRLLRDLAPELGKSIELTMTGAETELDRQLLEVIRDPLTHMVRNAADHGIESPAERLAAGKPARGTIRLSAFHEGGTITIEIADDGRGLDYAAIRRRADELGLVPAAELSRMGDDEVARLILSPGFSTSSAVSAVSGRGVGMDVVATNIGLIGGTIEVASEAGRGSAFSIRIPLTLAIVSALIVEAGGQRFAVPQTAALELVRVGAGGEHRLERIDAAPVLRLRGNLLPVVDLAAVLGLGPPRASDDGVVVVMAVGRRRFGALVSAVLESEEIVVKPISAKLRHIPFFSGSTVLGDGGVVLILDPNGIAREVGPEAVRVSADLSVTEAASADRGERTRLLVFRGIDHALAAVPLGLVTRLEEIAASALERVCGRAVVQYRGRLMPLVGLDSGAVADKASRHVVVVLGDGESAVGLCVEEIVDVVEDVLDVTPVLDRPNLVGSAIVRGRATEILDVANFLQQAAPLRAGSSDGSGRPLLLLVDDNAFFRNMLAPVLSAAGYRVRTAADASEARRAISDREPEVLVADVGRSDRSGLDLIGHFRAHARGIAILLASEADETVLRRAGELGVFDVVSKFDRQGLLSALAESRALDLAA